MMSGSAAPCMSLTLSLKLEVVSFPPQVRYLEIENSGSRQKICTVKNMPAPGSRRA